MSGAHEQILIEQAKQLGRLETSFEGVKEELKRQVKRAQEADDRQREILKNLALIQRDIEEMKPEVALVKGLRYKAAGAILVIGSIGALLGALFMAFWLPIRTALLKWMG